MTLGEREIATRSELQGVKKETPIREFVLQKKPRNNTTMTLIIAYYLEKYKGMSSITVRDLKLAFREANENVPENVSLHIIENLRKGFLMETEEKNGKRKAWILTTAGETYIQRRKS